MADHISGVSRTAGLADLIGEDGEDFALVGELGGDQFGFDGGLFLICGGLRLPSAGFLSWGDHKATVSSCI